MNNMKKTCFTAIAAMLITGMVMAQKTAPVLQASSHNASSEVKAVPAFAWEKTAFDFGKVPQNKPVMVTYSFTNTGKSPLVITNVAVQCGCTNADYSKEPVAPGSKGFVKLTFNAAAMGVFQKGVTVFANTPGEEKLNFSGEVIVNTTAER
jgi:hypothetical protein